MKMTSLFKMGVLAAGLIAAMGASAADGTVNISGKIIAAGCVIQGASTVAAQIDFGTLTPASFPAVGTLSPKKDVNFTLENCPTSVTSTKLIFTGTASVTDAALFALDPSSTATGLGIALFNKNGSQIPANGSSVVFPIDATTHTATIALQTAVKSTEKTVGGGTFVSRAIFAMTYN
ncbi:major type 1 subunit fimbrin (pilin) [Ewingella americana]